MSFAVRIFSEHIDLMLFYIVVKSAIKTLYLRQIIKLNIKDKLGCIQIYYSDNLVIIFYVLFKTNLDADKN